MASGKVKTWRRNLQRVSIALRRSAVGWGAVGIGLLFPPRCANCDADLGNRECDRDLPLCGLCAESFGPVEWVGCARCGAKIAPGASPEGPCLRCRGRRLHFDTVLPLGAYRGQLRSAVLQMKRPSGEPLAYALGRLYAFRRRGVLVDLRPDLVVPVPMHWFRRIVRKTNSPDLLAGQIARGLGVDFVAGLLRRSRNTRLQPDLAPAERFKNVRGAFALASDDDLSTRRVLLVDDVLTTGATASEAANVLKRAGAAMVAVAVIARAEGEGAV